jgi:hypothetical protein
MKPFTFVLLFISASVFAQNMPKPSIIGDYSKIYEVPNATQKDIYNRSKAWVATAFKSAKDVIQYDNAEEGKIICKGVVEIDATGLGMNGTIHTKQAGYVRFMVQVETKDGKCRVMISNQTHEAQLSGGLLTNEKPACGTFNMAMKTWQSVKDQTSDKLNAVLADLEKAINESKAADW